MRETLRKKITSNEKQFTVTREMLTVVARDQRWPDVVAGISAHFSKCAFALFSNITNHLMTDPLYWGTVNFVYLESQCFGNIEILGKQNSLFPFGTSH